LRKTTSLLILFFLLFLNLQAQKLDSIDWNRTFGGSGSDMAYDVIQNQDGDVLLVGEITEGDKQGALFVLDRDGNTKIKKFIGGNKSDGLKAIVESLDGHYFAAGYTESKTRGGKDGWLVKFDKEGKLVWQKNYGNFSDDEFFDMIETQDGNIVLVGYKSLNKGQQDMWIIKIDPNRKGKMIWEKKYGGSTIDQAVAIKETFEGNLVMTGVTKSEDAKNADVWTMLTDSDGETIWHRFSGGNEWDEPYDLIVTREDQIAVFGFTRSKGAGKQDMWLQVSDGDGNVLKDLTYGKSNDDIGNSILQTLHGNFLMAGTTYSWSGSAVTTQIQLFKADTAGVQLRKEAPIYLGGKRNDYAQKMVQLYDGSVVVVGRTDFKTKTDKGIWAIKVKTEGVPDQLYIPKLVVSNYEFKDENRNGYLDAEETALVSVDVTNEGTGVCYNLRAAVEGDIDEEVVSYSKSSYLGSIKPGETKTLGIPINSLYDLAGTSVDFEIVFTDAGKNEIEPYGFTILSETPILSIKDYAFTGREQKEIDRGHTVDFSINLRNIGKMPGENVKVEFVTPPGITPKSKAVFIKEQLVRKEDWEVKFTFKIDPYYQETEVYVNCIVTENGSNRYGTEQAISITLKEAPPLVSNMLNVNWEKPMVDVGAVSVATKQDYPIEVKAVSDASIERQNFSILVNGTEVKGRIENQYSNDAGSVEGEGKDIEYSQYYSNIVQLLPGMNRIEIVVANAAGTKKSIPHLVRYSPPKPNLYVLAIAPKSWELEYNRMDVRIFASILERQTDNLFGKVKTTIYTDDKITGNFNASSRQIKKAFESLIGYNSIQATDFVIIYYAGHGKSVKGKYYLMGSGYDAAKPNDNILDFNAEILPILRKMPCRQLLLMDVSKVGAKDKGIEPSAKQQKSNQYSNGALLDILSAEGNLSSIVSCRSNQVSYEDKQWESSALMKVIKDNIFDKGMTVSKLAGILETKVPALVEARNKRIDSSVLAIQKPFVSSAARVDKTLIYTVK